MWLMLQHNEPDDFVLATGITTTIREFTELSFAELDIPIEWSGTGINEVGKNAKSGKIIISIDPVYFRPTEVDLLVGDYSKAKEKLGWSPKFNLEQLISDMIKSDLKAAKIENN